MIFRLMLRGLARGKARLVCAIAGVAAACGAIVFVFSLTATNSAQAPALAKRATEPWSAWSVQGQFGMGRRGVAETEAPRREKGAEGQDGRRAGPRPDLELDLVGASIDYRPGGRVLQGPPMMVVVAAAPAANPYEAADLLPGGRWVDARAEDFEIVCTRNTLRRFGRGEPPPVGSEIKFVGRQGTMTARIVGYLVETRLPMGWPDVFANRAAFDAFKDEPHGRLSLWRQMPAMSADGTSAAGWPKLLTAESEQVVAAFRGDEQRRMDYARPLMLAAAILTALCLLVNSLLLSVESNRRNLAVLRMVGMTRRGAVGLVIAEALLATLMGWGMGGLCAIGALNLYVSLDPVAFPMGAVIAWRVVGTAFVLAVLVAGVAVLFALRPILSVRPLDALAARSRRRRRGMAVAFACGFGAFVAVEVWGASLMRGFVPSREWPDAIVSILPEGVSSFDVEKLRNLPGVARISELYPLQLDFDPPEEMPMGGRGGDMRRKPCRNALFLAAEWLPKFRFLEGTWEQADEAIRTSEACVITEMMSRARNLHIGDKLRVALGRRGPKTVVDLPVVAVVDLNWHMVTSRGLVRGLNGAPVMTDGPVFVSFDTIESLDARPAMMTKMTHLWVEYEPDFLKERGVFPAGRDVEKSIAAALGLDHSTEPLSSASAGQPTSTVRLHARDEIADGTLAHGSDLIGQAARVPFVFLAILALGFIAMLVADVEARKREFAILRAVGATRGQLVGRLVQGAVKTAMGGILIGLPVGALTGWLFSLKTGGAWPGMPPYFEVPWGVLVEGGLGALVFVLLIAVPTSLSLISRAMRGGIAR